MRVFGSLWFNVVAVVWSAFFLGLALYTGSYWAGPVHVVAISVQVFLLGMKVSEK